MKNTNDIRIKIEYLKKKLNELIENNGYCLTNPQVYEMSKIIDDLIAIYYDNITSKTQLNQRHLYEYRK
jgi:hypothetical protein